MAIPMDLQNAALEQIKRRRLRDLEIIAAEEAQAGVVPQVSVAPLPTYTSGMMGPEYADLAPDKGMLRSYSPPADFGRWPTSDPQPEESFAPPQVGISPLYGDSPQKSRPPYADLATYLGLGILGENVPRRDRPPSLTGGIAAGGKAYLEARQAQQNKGPMTKGRLWQLPDGTVIPAAVMNGIPYLDPAGTGNLIPYNQVKGAVPLEAVTQRRLNTKEERLKEAGDRSHRIATAARNNDFSGQSRIYTHEDVEDVTFFRTFLETEKEYKARGLPIHDSVNDVNLMYAYEAALNPHTRKVTGADTKIVKQINSVIQNVGFAIQGIYEGSFSMPDETRDMMRLFVQKSSDGRIKKMKDEVLPLTLQAWRSDPRWTPPGIVIRESRNSKDIMEPWWQWPDGSTVNMTNFYKTHGGTVVPTWDGYTE